MLVSRREGSEGFMSPVVSLGIISNIYYSITQIVMNIMFYYKSTETTVSNALEILLGHTQNLRLSSRT